MNVFDKLTNTQLIRAINSVKPYVVIDTGYSCNHSAGKVKFTTIYPDLNDDTIYGIDLSCSQDALHYSCKDMYDSIYRQWGIYCYNYASFGQFLKQTYSISEHQFQTLKRFCEE